MHLVVDSKRDVVLDSFVCRWMLLNILYRRQTNEYTCAEWSRSASEGISAALVACVPTAIRRLFGWQTMCKSSPSGTGRKKKNCYEVVVKAIRTDEVVAESPFEAKKARSVLSQGSRQRMLRQSKPRKSIERNRSDLFGSESP